MWHDNSTALRCHDSLLVLHYRHDPLLVLSLPLRSLSSESLPPTLLYHSIKSPNTESVWRRKLDAAAAAAKATRHHELLGTSSSSPPQPPTCYCFQLCCSPSVRHLPSDPRRARRSIVPLPHFATYLPPPTHAILANITYAITLVVLHLRLHDVRCATATKSSLLRAGHPVAHCPHTLVPKPASVLLINVRTNHGDTRSGGEHEEERCCGGLLVIVVVIIVVLIVPPTTPIPIAFAVWN